MVGLHMLIFIMVSIAVLHLYHDIEADVYDVEYTTPEGIVGVWVHFGVQLSSAL